LDGAEDPWLVRNHRFRRLAQGRSAGGIAADGSPVAA
jgi:hypothetical protein